MKTPRTDALFLKHCQEGPHDDRLAAGIRQVKELLEFTRQLETELAARDAELAEARASEENWRDMTLAIDGKLTAAREAIRGAMELLERTRTCHFFVVPIRVTDVIDQLRSCLPAPDCAGAVGRGGEKERGTSEKGETI